MKIFFVFTFILVISIIISCKKEQSNQEHINTLRESAQMWHFKSIQLHEKHKADSIQSLHRSDYKDALRESKYILKFHDQYLKCTYDSIQNISYDSLIIYEKFLAKKLPKNNKVSEIEDRTDLGLWLKVLQLSKREFEIIAYFEPLFGSITYCGFRKYRYQTEDSLKVNRPVNLLIMEYSDMEHGFLKYSLGNIQTYLNENSLKIKYEITQVNGITILRFIPHKSGLYTVKVPLKFIDHPTLNNTMICEMKVNN
jgi:hypothetical protein